MTTFGSPLLSFPESLTQLSKGIQHLITNHFHYLVEGREFTLWSNHKLLVAAFQLKSDQLIGRRAQQLSFISEFTTDVRHVRGDKNVIADVLSQLEINRIVFTQDALDYNEIAAAHRDDNDIMAWWMLSNKFDLKRIFAEWKQLITDL